MDLLSDILSQLRLAGSLYFRTAFTSPWSVQVPSFRDVSRFHFAHRGRCFVRVAGGEPVQLEQGDLIIITRGAAHTLYCDPATEKAAVMLDRVVEEAGFTGSGTLFYGPPEGDQETQLVCGHFAFDENASHPIIEALPCHIHIRNYGEQAGAWMENTLRVIGIEAGREEPGSGLIALKLSEIIFTQALRIYLSREGAGTPVWAGLAEPRIAAALKAVHQSPQNPWTLEALARTAGMSRTSFATVFARGMGMSAMGYVTLWRMQVARDLLVRTALPVVEIAERSGYGSEAAFGRVFKKQVGLSPARFRRRSRRDDALLPAVGRG